MLKDALANKHSERLTNLSLAITSSSTKTHMRCGLSGRPSKENSYSQIKRTDKEGTYIQIPPPPLRVRERQALYITIKPH